MIELKIRSYDPKKDKISVYRIWRETGWLEKGKEEIMDRFIECGRALVAEVNGEAECSVMTAPGDMKYLEEDLLFSGVIGVSTSRIARKQGLARKLTAQAVAKDAEEGVLVCGLGMFEQGYYNELGFGTCSYSNIISFDPSTLNIKIKARIPRRITTDDWSIAHKARLNRFRGHGACNLFSPEITRSQMLYTKNGFGLGYTDGNHTLSHYIWMGAEDVERGPYYVGWLVFRKPEQFLELIALIKTLGDQVRVVRIHEPQGIQFQDLLQTPFKFRQMTRKSNYESNMRASAYTQIRICDLEGCLSKTHLRGEEVRFNLKLVDPIERFLDEKVLWRGLTGNYVVRLGSSSDAEMGKDQSLPTLTASVNAFTRMWLGVRSATGLSVTDNLSGPSNLLKRLDWALCLPVPNLDWDF